MSVASDMGMTQIKLYRHTGLAPVSMAIIDQRFEQRETEYSRVKHSAAQRQ